ncbi:RAM signaling pathway protein-domain-containing protein [Chaetomium sp. MPI-CAGE-AT-0009]|nr:RAM signaling pathway protein-domain-containing protein [Chaetomium sp. MPI-CAGE-AT-0009]
MDFPRGLPDNPAQARRAIAAAALANPTPPPPVPSLRDVPSSSNLSAGQPISPNQVLAVAREAMRAAHENEAKAAEASGVSNTLKPGLTIDLSRKKIQMLPEEIVDVIKDELERFSECTSLRYLNVRQNRIKEFPLALCDLKSLEILDLGRNMLQVLPPEIVKLSSLKVLSIPKNKITHLPLCLADMPSLSVGTGGQGDGPGRETELTEVAATAVIKKFLKQEASGRADSPGDGASEGAETPRPTIKRVFSGRFPIKVNGSDITDVRSPALPRPPPIPSRSHYRGLSQQNTAQRRPAVMPLTIGNPNERVRSNSETIIQTSSRERSESRSRRMGMVSKRSELSTLEEIEVNNRFSHYRGLSHGSAMQGNGASMQVKSPNMGSPAAEPALQRPVYIRRLSILPERKRDSKAFDPVLEAAKGILYSIFQIHPMIQALLVGLTNDGTSRRSNLEIVFYNTNAHVEQLELEIQQHEQAQDGFGQKENENVQRACVTLINAYTHVCSLLMSNVDLFLDNGDPRYIRTLLTQLYNSIMELRVTCTQVAAEGNHRSVPSFSRPDLGETIRPHSRENSVTPTADRILNRSRNGTFVYNPSNLRVATDVSIPYINGSGRSAMVGAATPRSGESFASTSTTGTRNLSADFTEEDRLFERIFLSLHKTTELVMQVLPTMNTQFMSSMRTTTTQRSPDHLIQCWKALVAKCNTSIQQTEVLKARLSSIKLKEPGIRTQPSFWRLCNSFIDSWYILIKKIMQLQNDVQLPIDTKARLRPIQKSMKDTCDLMMSSPWSYFLRHPGSEPITSPYIGARAATPVQMPMTPQSAALGPAVQATVPSTPQSASFSLAFSGVFERDRSDTLLSSMGGSGAASAAAAVVGGWAPGSMA